MLIEDRLLQLYNDLNILEGDKVTLVKEDKDGVGYYQIGKELHIPYLRLYYYSTKKFKYGLLTPSGLASLRSDILSILQHPLLKEERLLFTPKNYAISVLTLVDNDKLSRRGPQEIYKIKLVNVTNRFLSNLILRYNSSQSKLLAKMK